MNGLRIRFCMAKAIKNAFKIFLIKRGKRDFKCQYRMDGFCVIAQPVGMGSKIQIYNYLQLVFTHCWVRRNKTHINKIKTALIARIAKVRIFTAACNLKPKYKHAKLTRYTYPDLKLRSLDTQCQFSWPNNAM